MTKKVSVRLDDPANRAWDDFVRRHGVTKTGLAQALGEILAAGDDGWIPEEAVTRARQIDRERRRRPQA